MTDEGIAEQWLDEKYLKDMGIRNPCKQAYLAGLKAGRPKFHKIAFEGLPTDSRGQTYVVVDEYDCCMLASLDNGVWHNYHDIENVVAWCEVPKFSE